MRHRSSAPSGHTGRCFGAAVAGVPLLAVAGNPEMRRARVLLSPDRDQSFGGVTPHHPGPRSSELQRLRRLRTSALAGPVAALPLPRARWVRLCSSQVKPG